MNTNFLTTTILSLSLLTGTLSADKICTGDHCILDLSKLSHSKKLEVNNSSYKGRSFKLKGIERDRLTQSGMKKSYITTQKIELHKRNELLNEAELETIAFSHEKYIMTPEEIENYQVENFLMLPLNEIENRIINKTKLPVSEYFCENDMKPIYNNLSNTYECA